MTSWRSLNLHRGIAARYSSSSATPTAMSSSCPLALLASVGVVDSIAVVAVAVTVAVGEWFGVGAMKRNDGGSRRASVGRVLLVRLD